MWGITPNQATSDNPLEIVHDRFGNSYDIEDLNNSDNDAAEQSFLVVNTTYFVLDFSDNYTSTERNTIVQAFEDISTLFDFTDHSVSCDADVGNDKPFIRLSKFDDPSSSPLLGAASPIIYSNKTRFGENDCNLLSINSVRETLLTGFSSQNTDGLLAINSDSDLFHKTMSLPVPNNEYDLYSVVSHEILHLLGFYSTINFSDDDGNSIWDTKLSISENFPENTIISDLLFNDCSSRCYANSLSEAELHDQVIDNCNVTNTLVYGEGLNIPIAGGKGVIPMGTPDQVDNLFRNMLGHLSEDCKDQENIYLMAPSINMGIRKPISTDESSIICDLGYCENNNQKCYVIPTYDFNLNHTLYNWIHPLQTCCEKLFNSCAGTKIDIPFSDLLCNDFSTEEINITDVRIINSGNFPPGSSVNIVANNVEFTSAPNAGGFAFTLGYTIESCDCTMIESYFQVFISACNDCTNVDECESLVCYNGFEDIVLYEDGQNTFNATSLDLINYRFEINFQNTPDFANDIVNNNTYLLCAQTESFGVNLNSPLGEDCTLKLKGKGFITDIYGLNLSIVGSKNLPCPFEEDKPFQYFPNDICDYTISCANYNVDLICIDNAVSLNYIDGSNGIPDENSPDLKEFEIEWENVSGDEVNYLYFFLNGEYTNVIDWMGIDDLQITTTCSTAEFDYTEGENCNVINFTSNTENGDTHLWDFGDMGTSTESSPSHTYEENGTFTVHHTVIDECNNVFDEILTVIIDCPCFHLPDFTVQQLSCDTYIFTPLTSFPSDTHFWDFGDGTTSNEENPTHTFTNNCLFDVLHSLTDDCDIKSESSQPVEVSCVSTFTCDIPGEDIIYIDASGGLLLSEAIVCNQLDPNTLVSQTLVIKGTLTLDINYTFNDITFNMDPGSEIIVRSPGYIRIVNSELMGCTHMWKGISVYGTSPENVFSFGNNYISDAYRALTILDGSNIQQFKNIFDTNYIGIYSPRNNGIMKTHYGSSITRSTFISEKEMLPYYPGQPGWKEVTFYGIQVHDLDHLIVTKFNSQIGGPGPTPTYRNRFERIARGIDYDNVNIRIIGNEFYNLQSSGVHYAIRGRRCNNTYIGDNEFLNVNYAMFLSNSENAKIIVSGNKFKEDEECVDIGGGIKIWMDAIHSSDFTIVNNEVNNDKIGGAIKLSFCNSSKSVRVFYNRINALIFLENVHKVTGAEGIVSNNSSLWDDPNKNIYCGIALKNTDNFVVSDNSFSVYYTFGVWWIYGFTNSKECLVNDNKVIFSQLTSGNIGFNIGNSPGNIYCCNTAVNASKGMNFFGENKDTELRSSIFENNEYGLYLNNAEIGSQDLYGNYWENDVAVTKARYKVTMGANDSYEASLFTVNSGQPGTRPITVIPNEWFENVDGQATLCPANNSDETCGSPNWDGFNFTGTIPNGDPCELFKDELITLVGPEVYWHFQNQNDWVFYSYVFDNYKDIPLAFWEDCFPIPEKEVNVKTVAAYYHTDKSYKEAYKPTESEGTLLNSLQSTLNDDLENLISILDNVETEEDYENNMTAIINLQNQIHQVSIDFNNINNVIKIRGESTLQGLTNHVNSLPSDFYFLDELKYVWSVKIQIDLFEIESVTTIQWNEIERIANECVLEYGNAVFEAQSLMNLIGETSFDNEANCETTKPRKSLSNEEFINVYPNPSNGIYTIELSNDPSGLESINVYDINGRVVFAKEIKDRDSKFSFDMSDMKNGIYYLKIIQNKGIIYQKKLILIK